MSEEPVIAKVAGSVGALARDEWDALAGGNPFMSHDFLTALEDSGSVGAGTGWQPAPIVIEGADGKLAAALPAYLKGHSQGEYVFDHAWADAYERAGGQQNDVIVEIEGHAVNTFDALVSRLRRLRAGQVASIRILRGDAGTTLDVTLDRLTP